ncbi:MAG: hypothetical protein M3447_02135 [Acidobacteriota bacterium]|nr:hypothetical protein [Acidobacteriota bacterium]
MKEFQQVEQRRLYVVAAPRFDRDVFDVTRNTLDQSFEGWLREVAAMEELNMSAPAVVIKPDLRRPSELTKKHALKLCQTVQAQHERNGPIVVKHSSELTTQDYVQVMLATIREGRRHARWPTEVVAHFLAAEVVTGE